MDEEGGECDRVMALISFLPPAASMYSPDMCAKPPLIHFYPILLSHDYVNELFSVFIELLSWFVITTHFPVGLFQLFTFNVTIKYLSFNFGVFPPHFLFLARSSFFSIYLLSIV